MRSLATGLVCLLSLSVASGVRADEPAAPNGEPPAPNGEPAAPNGEPPVPNGEPAVSNGEPAAPNGEPAAPSGEPPAANSEPAAPNGEPALPSGQPPAAEPPASEPPEVKPPEVRRIPGALTGAPPPTQRLLIPPFMRDRRGEITTTALFPLYFARTGPQLRERLVLPYYFRRSPSLDVDVAAGLIWSLRGPDRNTFVLPPLYTHRRGRDWAVGLLPLFATGIFDGHHHTVIPPLLTWIDGDADSRRTVVGPYFDVREGPRRFWGLIPFVWSKADDVDRFTLVPPLYFRFADDDPIAYTTVVPPFFHKRREGQTTWGLVPLLFHKRTAQLAATTVPLTLFHFARGPETFRLITPIFGHLRDEDNERWTITPVYQRRRGDRNLDGVGPFFFRTWDDRDASSGLFFPPIYWHWEDPANDTSVVFPFFGRSYRIGIGHTWITPLLAHSTSFERLDDTWWVPPTFHFNRTEAGWKFNLHPVVYLKRTKKRDHTVLAPLWFRFVNRTAQTHRRTLFPLYWHFEHFAKQREQRVILPVYWDFQKRKQGRRRIVGFPLYWDFRDELAHERHVVAFPLLWRNETPTRTRTLVLNTYYERARVGDNWHLEIAPILSAGRGEHERWWNLFYGLAGYERRGSYRRMRVFWIPFNLRQR